jgi:ABC-2 type transport system permease protein
MSDFITVYSAEVLRRLRSRSFMVGLLIGALGLLVMIRLPHYIDTLGSSYKVLLGGDPAIVSAARPLLKKDFNITAVEPGLLHPSERDLRLHENASAVIVLTRSRNGLGVNVYAKDPAAVSAAQLRRDLLPLHIGLATRLSPDRVSSLVHLPIRVDPLASKFGTAQQADQARGVAYLLIILLYLLIVLNSQLLMTSVAEEKTSRIAELLVAAVNPSVLLTAKIASSATLAVVQMAAWAAMGFLASAGNATPAHGEVSIDQSFTLSSVPASDIAGFIVFFVLGYLQTAVMFAAVGSLINRTEDIGSIGGPFFMPVVAALIIAMMALQVPDAPLVIVTSFIPLIAPFVMFARIVVSTVPFWQIALSFAINAAAIYFFALLGGKIYRIGMLLYGRAPKFSQLVRALRA